MTRSIELLGAAPISVTVSELTVAMQTGMFEGMIVSLSPGYIRYLGYLDYNAYLFEFPITYTLSSTALNTEWYTGLPDDVRLAFETILPNWYTNLDSAGVADRAIGIQMWEDDCEEFVPSEAEMDRWTAAISPVIDEVDARIGGGLIDAAYRTMYGDPQGQYGGLILGQPIDDRYENGVHHILLPR